jgi:ABC-type uncharacterized transport system substrate-binding protein
VVVSTATANSRTKKLPKDLAAVSDIAIEVHGASNIEQLSNALAKIPRSDPDMLVVLTDPFMFTHRKPIVSAAERLRLPAIYAFREYVDDGGLISYGVSITDTYRRAAGYVDKILRGAKPADLPSSCRPSLNSLSTSRSPSRSASRFPRACSPSPTR